MLEVRDLADVHSVVREVPSMTAADVTGAPGLRFRTQIKTTAVRYQW
jgi:hypothetical protein